MRENLRFVGVMTAKLYDKNGNCKEKVSKNLILNSGFDFIADAISATTRPAAMNIIAVGTDETPQQADNTSLGSQIAEVQGEYTHIKNTKNFRVTAEFPAGTGTGALKEAGVKNSAGVFIDRTTFEVINKGEQDSLEIDFTFTME